MCKDLIETLFFGLEPARYKEVFLLNPFIYSAADENTSKYTIDEPHLHSVRSVNQTTLCSLWIYNSKSNICFKTNSKYKTIS